MRKWEKHTEEEGVVDLGLERLRIRLSGVGRINGVPQNHLF